MGGFKFEMGDNAAGNLAATAGLIRTMGQDYRAREEFKLKKIRDDKTMNYLNRIEKAEQEGVDIRFNPDDPSADSLAWHRAMAMKAKAVHNQMVSQQDRHKMVADKIAFDHDNIVRHMNRADAHFKLGAMEQGFEEITEAYKWHPDGWDVEIYQSDDGRWHQKVVDEGGNLIKETAYDSPQELQKAVADQAKSVLDPGQYQKMAFTTRQEHIAGNEQKIANPTDVLISKDDKTGKYRKIYKVTDLKDPNTGKAKNDPENGIYGGTMYMFYGQPVTPEFVQKNGYVSMKQQKTMSEIQDKDAEAAGRGLTAKDRRSNDEKIVDMYAEVYDIPKDDALDMYREDENFKQAIKMIADSFAGMDLSKERNQKSAEAIRDKVLEMMPKPPESLTSRRRKATAAKGAEEHEERRKGLTGGLPINQKAGSDAAKSGKGKPTKEEAQALVKKYGVAEAKRRLSKKYPGVKF